MKPIKFEDIEVGMFVTSSGWNNNFYEVTEKTTDMLRVDSKAFNKDSPDYKFNFPSYTRNTQFYVKKSMSEDTDEQKALDIQVGGDHYKTMPIQPMEYSMKNGLDACQHTIIKYVTRFRDKGGIEDLEKAKHCIDLLIGFEREKENG